MALSMCGPPEGPAALTRNPLWGEGRDEGDASASAFVAALLLRSRPIVRSRRARRPGAPQSTNTRVVSRLLRKRDGARRLAYSCTGQSLVAWGDRCQFFSSPP